MDLSDLLRKLAGLSSERQGGRQVASSHPRGKELARLTRSLGLNITRFSKSIVESLKMRADVNLEGNSSGGFSATDGTSEKPSRAGNNPRQKRAKIKMARRKEKKVKGPKARRRGG